jgi:hypothetical protein
MRALVEETDPVVLEGFAESIRALYPTAADILARCAHTLRSPAAGPLVPAEGLAVTAEPATSLDPFPSSTAEVQS